jgi:hypothetical protein
LRFHENKAQLAVNVIVRPEILLCPGGRHFTSAEKYFSPSSGGDFAAWMSPAAGSAGIY